MLKKLLNYWAGLALLFFVGSWVLSGYINPYTVVGLSFVTALAWVLLDRSMEKRLAPHRNKRKRDQ